MSFFKVVKSKQCYLHTKTNADNMHIFLYFIFKQDQTLLWTCIAGAHWCVNSRYAKFKYTGMKSDYIQITQRNIQKVNYNHCNHLDGEERADCFA